MPYQYVSATAKENGLTALWQPADVQNMVIKDIYATYADVWLTLAHPSSPRPLYLLMSEVRASIAPTYSHYTVANWLAAIGNASLPTSPMEPVITTTHVKFIDAWKAGYDIKKIDIGRNEDTQVPNFELNDLLISREDVDFGIYHRRALVSVNGYFHRTGVAGTKLHVLDGGRTGSLGNDNRVGLISFNDVAAIDLIPITPDMILKASIDTPLHLRHTIKLPFSIENKTILLCVGGYLQILDSTYQVIGSNSISVNFARMGWPERYFDSIGKIDLSSLPLTPIDDDHTHVSVEELLSDEVVRAWMTMSQSFLVVVNSDRIYKRIHYCGNAEMPGRFETDEDKKLMPMFAGYGRHVNYLSYDDWGVRIHAAHPNDNVRLNYMFRMARWLEEGAIDSSLQVQRPWEWANGYMVELGRSY